MTVRQLKSKVLCLKRLKDNIFFPFYKNNEKVQLLIYSVNSKRKISYANFIFNIPIQY